MPNKLHFYTKLSKEKIKLASKPFASGGEGALYAIASPRELKHMVAKIYYPEKRTPEREAKMGYLMQHPPIKFSRNQHPSIAWVQDILYKNDRFIGILLVKLEGKKLTKLTLSKLRRRAGEEWKRFAFGQAGALKLRMHFCFNIAVVLHQIHQSNRYVLVDLKPDNVMIQANGLVSLVDMDSVEVLENGKAIFAAPVATPEYTPPEHYYENRTTIQETWDRFSMGVIFYQLLFGLHPFTASANPPYDHLVGLHDKIKARLFVHNPKFQKDFKIIPPPHKRFHDAPAELQQLFQDCFSSGSFHPDMRPAAVDWCVVLARLLNLPFTSIPSVGIPPSNLYFQPHSIANLQDLDQPLPKALVSLPVLGDLDNSEMILNLKEPALLEDTNNILKEKYRLVLRKYRERFFFLWGPLFLLASFFLFANTTAMSLGILLACVLLYNTFFESKPQITKELAEGLGFNYDSIHREKKMVEIALSSQQRILEAQKAKTKKSRSYFNADNFDSIQQYFLNRNNFERELKDYKIWLDETEKTLHSMRTEELSLYKNLNVHLLEALESNERFESYNFQSFSALKSQIERKIQIKEEAHKQLDAQIQQEFTEKYELAIERLHSEFEEEIVTYSIHQEEKTQEKLDQFIEEQKNTNQSEKDYEQFLRHKKQLEIKLKKSRSKIQAAVRKSLQKTRKDLRLQSEQDLEKMIELWHSIDEKDKQGVLLHQCKKEIRDHQIQLENLDLDNSSLRQFIENLDFKLEHPVNHAKSDFSSNFDDIDILYTTMIRVRKDVENNQKELIEDIQNLIVVATNEGDPIAFAYTINDCSKHLQQLKYNLKQLDKLQKQFYEDSVMGSLILHLNSHKNLQKEVDEKLAALDLAHEENITHLEEAYAEAIDYHKKIDTFKAQEKEALEQYKENLLQKEQADLDRYSKEKTKELEEAKTFYDKQYRLAVAKREKQIEGDRAVLNQDLTILKETLATLDEIYEEHKNQVEQKKKDFEKEYSEKRASLEQRQEHLETLLKAIQKDHPKVKQLLEEQQQQKQQQDFIENEANYQTKLIKLAELNEKKIKLDSLLKLEEDFDSGRFIKDLLLNRVEQIEKKNT